MDVGGGPLLIGSMRKHGSGSPPRRHVAKSVESSRTCRNPSWDFLLTHQDCELIPRPGDKAYLVVRYFPPALPPLSLAQFG